MSTRSFWHPRAQCTLLVSASASSARFAASGARGAPWESVKSRAMDEMDVLSDLLYTLHRFALLPDPLGDFSADFWQVSCRLGLSRLGLPAIKRSMSMFSRTLPTMVGASRSAVVKGNMTPEVMLQMA